jgi:hypothetical protein
MDKDETILTLRKNKLDMEHDTLLQDRNVIVLTEAGLPITVFNLVITAQLYNSTSLALIAIVVAFTMGVIEFFRRRNSEEIAKKHEAVDILVRQVEKQSSTNIPH